MKEPVLVRIMPPDQVTSDIGDISNTTGTAALSPLEQAKNDARRIDISAIEFGENGISPQNVRDFVNAMPVSEQVGLMTPDGQPTKQAHDRLMAAVFQAAYEDDQLVNLYAQAADPESRTVLNGLAMAAHKMAKLRDAGEFDIRELVTEAAMTAVNAARRGEKLSDYAKTRDMARSEETDAIVQMLADNIRSANRIGESLSVLADGMINALQSQDSLFGDPISRQQVFDNWRNSHGTQQRSEGNLQKQKGTGTPQNPDAGKDTDTAGSADVTGTGRTEQEAPAGRRKTEEPVNDFALESPTPEQLRQQEAERTAQQKREEQERQAADKKAQADQEREQFALTGSDREADVLAAQGQESLFEAGTEQEKQVVQFSGKELGGLDIPIKTLKVRAANYAREHFSGKTVTIASDGSQVHIPWQGIKHALSGQVHPVSAIVTSKLDTLIEKGVLAKTEEDRKDRPDIKAAYFYDTPIRINGKDDVVRIVVREHIDGKRYYDHFKIRSDKTEISESPDRSNASAGPTGRVTGAMSGSTAHQPNRSVGEPPDSTISESARDSKQSQESYSRQIDDLLQGKRIGSVSLGLPSEKLVMSGVANVVMHITGNTARKIVGGKHNLTSEQLKNLPALLDSPVMVFQSATDGGHVVVVDDVAMTESGTTEPIIVIIRPNGEVTVNHIRSAYPRNNFAQAIERWAKDGLLISAQKEIAIDFLEQFAKGLQLPNAVQAINSDSVINLSQVSNESNLNPAATEATPSETEETTVKTIEERETDKGIALFSRSGKKDTAGRGLSVEAVQRGLDDIKQWYRNAPELVVVEKTSDLPFDAPNNVKGAYWGKDGRCYFVSSIITDAADIRDVFGHEVLRHFGLRHFFGDRLNAELDFILAHNKNVRESAEKWIKDNTDFIRDTRKKISSDGEFVRWRKYRAIEEALAHMKGNITGIKKLVYAIQKLLRAIGMDSLTLWQEPFWRNDPEWTDDMCWLQYKKKPLRNGLRSESYSCPRWFKPFKTVPRSIYHRYPMRTT